MKSQVEGAGGGLDNLLMSTEVGIISHLKDKLGTKTANVLTVITEIYFSFKGIFS
jgi:hypothetical protein